MKHLNFVFAHLCEKMSGSEIESFVKEAARGEESMSFTQFMSMFRVTPPGEKRRGRRDEHPGRKRPPSRGEPRVTPPRTYQASAPDSTTDDARANERILSP